MVLIRLNTHLDPIEYQVPNQNNILVSIQNHGYKDFKIVETNISENNLTFTNLFEIIKFCYANHCIPTISPSDICYTILSVISQTITNNSEQYKKIFTNSNLKTTISINSMSCDLPIEDYLSLINQISPINIIDLNPKFSTDTDISIKARLLCLAEITSPYYQCFMYSCGIPAIEIDGECQDWINLKVFIETFKNIIILNCNDKTSSLIRYFEAIVPIIDNLISISYGNEDKHKQFLENIFENTTCGSGGQEAVKGWICTLYGFLDSQNNPIMYDTFKNHSHISTFKYQFNSINYKLHYGINTVKIINQSILSKNYYQLVPTYNKTICIQQNHSNKIQPELNVGYLRYNIPKKKKILDYFIHQHLYKNILNTEPNSTLCLSTISNNNITTDYKKYQRISDWWYEKFKNYNLIHFKKINLEKFQKVVDKIDTQIESGNIILEDYTKQGLDYNYKILQLKIEQLNLIDYNILIEYEKDYLKSICQPDFEGIEIKFLEEEISQNYICLVYKIVDINNLDVKN